MVSDSEQFIGRIGQDQVVEDFAEYVSPGKVEVYRALGMARVPGRRQGVYVWDLEGNRYINCRSSGGVFNLGHRPELVVKALRAALDELDVGDHLLISEQRARLARRLAELTPDDLHYTFFAPSGGEAVDIALKLARGYTGRSGVISAQLGYHGHTGFALSAGDPYFKRHFEPLIPGFSQVPFGDAEALAEALTPDTAAFILETIPATAGILIPPDDYLPRVRRSCDENGTLLILDEVQAGLGRTGRLWAFSEWDIVPDMVILGKGLSGGVYPISAVVYRRPLDRFFREHPFVHLSSFGGADLGCVAALALLDQVSQPELLDHVRSMGSRLEAGLAVLRDRYPDLVTGWRRRGLMIGLDTASDEMGPLLSYTLGRNGVIAVFCDFRRRCIQLIPPLIISPDEVDQLLEALDAALADLTRLVAAGVEVPYIP